MAILKERPQIRTAPARPPGAVDWGAAGWAGFAAGLLVMALELAVAALTGAQWMPSRLIAAVVLGDGVMTPPAEYRAVIFAAAFAVHMTLSLFFARLMALIFHRQRLSFAVEEGLMFGAALYALNFHVLSLLFPFVATGRGLTTLAFHLVFGACVPLFYREFTRRAAMEPRRPWAKWRRRV